MVKSQTNLDPTACQDSPRDHAVSVWMKNYEREMFGEQYTKYKQRQNNELLSVYTETQFKDIQSYCLIRGTMLDFRAKLNLLMGHWMLLRSQNRLAAELADIFILPIADEGLRGDVNMLFIALRGGKV
jgi:hypothetical protein